MALMAMAQRSTRNFAMAPLFDVTAYGAAGDGATLDTGAIAAAFADCAAHGGGTVCSFPVEDGAT